MVVKNVHDITREIWNRTQPHKDLHRHPICLTGYDNDYIIDEIVRR